MSAVTIESLTVDHWSEVAKIYESGIATGHATFESTVPSWAEFDRSRPINLRLVASRHGELCGWVAASPVSERCVYQGVVEHSIYVSPSHRTAGVGLQLLGSLLDLSADQGIWTVQSGLFAENTASRRLHAKAGFREIGVRSRIGLMTYGPMTGVWRDVIAIEHRQP